jgi:hypothetical protein
MPRKAQIRSLFEMSQSVMKEDHVYLAVQGGELDKRPPRWARGRLSVILHELGREGRIVNDAGRWRAYRKGDPDVGVVLMPSVSQVLQVLETDYEFALGVGEVYMRALSGDERVFFMPVQAEKKMNRILERLCGQDRIGRVRVWGPDMKFTEEFFVYEEADWEYPESDDTTGSGDKSGVSPCRDPLCRRDHSRWSRLRDARTYQHEFCPPTEDEVMQVLKDAFGDLLEVEEVYRRAVRIDPSVEKIPLRAYEKTGEVLHKLLKRGQLRKLRPRGLDSDACFYIPRIRMPDPDSSGHSLVAPVGECGLCSEEAELPGESQVLAVLQRAFGFSLLASEVYVRCFCSSKGIASMPAGAEEGMHRILSYLIGQGEIFRLKALGLGDHSLSAERFAAQSRPTPWGETRTADVRSDHVNEEDVERSANTVDMPPSARDEVQRELTRLLNPDGRLVQQDVYWRHSRWSRRPVQKTAGPVVPSGAQIRRVLMRTAGSPIEVGEVYTRALQGRVGRVGMPPEVRSLMTQKLRSLMREGLAKQVGSRWTGAGDSDPALGKP